MNEKKTVKGYEPNLVRSIHPKAYPQWPFDEPPKVPESSQPVYTISADLDQMIGMRDDVNLAADVFRPSSPGDKFPVLLSLSPYTRGLQSTNVAISQNEAGITEFWVPRGYVHVIVDVRGTNDSGGVYDDKGEKEQSDYLDLIEWCGTQSWSNGSVGMMGCSYFAESQVLAATLKPHHLKAIFPYDAFTDLYRNRNYHGGIPYTGFMWNWYSAVSNLNFGSGRLEEPAGIQKLIREGICYERPLDDEYYRIRSPFYRLDQIEIPTYFGCDWTFWWLHLQGSFDGWEGTGDIPKKMLIGPRPEPWRPFAAYQEEALRWYDYWLKGLDTRVMDGPPIQLYVQGKDIWRGEHEWPISRAKIVKFYLGGEADGLEGSLLDSAPSGLERTYVSDPKNAEYRHGKPKLIYRSDPITDEFEILGPLSLHLVAKSSCEDTDWLVSLFDESPEGSSRILTSGWLRASHRELDTKRSKQCAPWHPHTRVIPLTPGKEEIFEIGLVPTSNHFFKGHRLRLEISSSASAADRTNFHDTLPFYTENTVLEGKEGSFIEISCV